MIINNQEKHHNLICLAEVTSAHGIKGAVKIKTFTEHPSDIMFYKSLMDHLGNFYKLNILAMPSVHSLVVSLDGVNDRNAAENLRGFKLYVDRNVLPDLEEEEFYYADLLKMKVMDIFGKLVGVVHAVHNHGAGCFFDIMLESKEIHSIPFIKEAVPIVDVNRKSITINRDFLLGTKG